MRPGMRPAIRPWTELSELVAREETRLGIRTGDEAASGTPSARLLAILSSLRAVAEHEARRAQAAEAALARLEVAREAERAEIVAQTEARATAETDRDELLKLLLQMAQLVESLKAMGGRKVPHPARKARPISRKAA